MVMSIKQFYLLLSLPLLLNGLVVAQNQSEVFNELSAHIREFENAEFTSKLSELNDIDYIDGNTGFTLLILAAGFGNTELLKLLIENGAKVNLVSPNKVTATYVAAITGQYESLVTLLGHRGDIDFKDNEGISALFYASRNLNVDWVHTLIESGADIELRCTENELTPIIYASEWGRLDVVRLLIQAGANVNATGYNGVSAIMASAGNGYYGSEIIKELISAGADVNLSFTNGVTPLMFTLQAGPYIEIAKLLIENGADLDAKNESGQSVMDYARYFVKDEDFISYLESKAAR